MTSFRQNKGICICFCCTGRIGVTLPWIKYVHLYANVMSQHKDGFHERECMDAKA